MIAIPVDNIVVGQRHRQDMGDLQLLADSISAIGLLQPIGVTSNHELVFGERRYRAVRDILGWAEIPARIIDVPSIVEGEYAENEIRKDFSLSERVAIGKAVEVELGRRAGRPKARANIVENFPQLTPGMKTRDIAAERAGFGNPRTYEQAKSVIDHGAPELVTAVEQGKVAVSTAATITALPAEEQAELVARGEKEILQKAKEIRREKTLQRRVERQEKLQSQEWPANKYRVIYADPPWEYDQVIEQYGPAERHYPTMPTEQICALSVQELALPDSVLFIWTTSPKIEDALQVVHSWGFTYKAMFVWDKVKHNYGHYNSVRHELLFICTRGSCLPDVPELVDSVVTLERSDKHSEKPEYFRELIDKLYPHGPRIELFARKAADGWEAWGNEQCQ